MLDVASLFHVSHSGGFVVASHWSFACLSMGRSKHFFKKAFHWSASDVFQCSFLYGFLRGCSEFCTIRAWLIHAHRDRHFTCWRKVQKLYASLFNPLSCPTYHRIALIFPLHTLRATSDIFQMPLHLGLLLGNVVCTKQTHLHEIRCKHQHQEVGPLLCCLDSFPASVTARCLVFFPRHLKLDAQVQSWTSWVPKNMAAILPSQTPADKVCSLQEELSQWLFFFLILLKSSWFTMLCWFLLYSKATPSYIDIHSFF